jgi:adenylylsulfate kinase
MNKAFPPDVGISGEQRRVAYGHDACCLWFTGLSGSGKSTIAHGVEKLLFDRKVHTYVLDGDSIRTGLCRDLGFSEHDRVENIRRIGEVTRLFVDAGLVVLVSFISPFRKDRDSIRQLLPKGKFVEAYVKADLETCIKRDPKGLYKKAIAEDIPDFTGISSPYEEPLKPELVLDTTLQPDAAKHVSTIVSYLEKRGLI